MAELADPVPNAVTERRAEQAKEYGQYVATEQIYVDGALAFNPGDPVPAGHVKRYEMTKHKLVRRTDTDPEPQPEVTPKKTG